MVSIIKTEEINIVSLPFPSFQPNTIILSEQVNDNNEELQYKTNLLINSYNKHLIDALNLETALNTHVGNYNTFVTQTGTNFANTTNTINTNNNTINARVTQEVATLNNTITTNATTINNTINANKASADSSINYLDSHKGDKLELKNTLLYLKSGDTIISVADLAGFGGGGTGGGAGVNIATQLLVKTTDWLLEEGTGKYYYVFKHDLNTSTPLVIGYEQVNFDAVYLPCRVVDANNVKIYTDEAVDVFVSVVNGSTEVTLVQAVLDDENITPYRTWSSEKIKAYIDANTPTITAEATTFDNTSNGMTATNVQDAIDEIKTALAGVDGALIQIANELLIEL